jgi:hypothetical protein
MIETKPKQVGVAVDVNGYDCLKRVYSPEGKSPTVTTCQGGNTEPKVVTGGAFRGRAFDKNGKRLGMNGESIAGISTQMLELRKDDKSNAITTVGKDSVVAHEDLTWRKLTLVASVKGCKQYQMIIQTMYQTLKDIRCLAMVGRLKLLSISL